MDVANVNLEIDIQIGFLAYITFLYNIGLLYNKILGRLRQVLEALNGD